jgi:hypothetical protein
MSNLDSLLNGTAAFGKEYSYPTSTVPLTGGTPATDCLAKRALGTPATRREASPLG